MSINEIKNDIIDLLNEINNKINNTKINKINQLTIYYYNKLNNNKLLITSDNKCKYCDRNSLYKNKNKIYLCWIHSIA
jgi:hypothetical protein